MIRSRKGAVECARQYLACGTAAEATALQVELDGYRGDFDEVVRALRPRPPARVETGWLQNRPFRTPRLAAKYPQELLQLYVPPEYTPSRARGVLLFLHGGGHSTPRDAAKMVRGFGLSDLFEASGRIVCAPCAPANRHSFASWNLPQVDEYLMDVLEELEHGYAIDPHNVILGGFSMGGMGAYHLAHRLADRFASVMACAGCWDLAYWPCLTGTTLWIVHGINDAVLFRRRHGTDIEFARLARQRLDQAGVPCVYREHSGCHHPGDARVAVREWLAAAAEQRRDPCYPHVVAVSPRGMSPYIDWHRHKASPAHDQNRIDFHELDDAPHARWVTIDGVGTESVIFDEVLMSPCNDAAEADWNGFHLTLRRKHVPAGVVEAVRRDDGAIEVTPRNVTGFTLWLHPRLVDFAGVRVLVKGQERFNGPVSPSLGTLLESYRRRRDWGLLYPAKLRIEADETWEARDQLKLGERV